MRILFLIIFMMFSSISMCQDDAYDLACFGNEPYWQLNLNEHEVLFDDYSDNIIKLKVSKINTSINKTNLHYYDLIYDDGSAVLIINQTGQCSDGMSDIDHQYEIFFKNDNLYSGCCRQIDE